MKKIFLFLITCNLYALAYAQTYPGYTPPPNAISPQTSEMIRYDQIPVNLYTGCINLQIPLISIQDKDFNLPISIQYNSAGFRPFEPDNYVGRNWALSCGGLIYREINGVPDDLQEVQVAPNSPHLAMQGFLAVNKLHKNVLSRDDIKKQIYTNPYQYARRHNMEAEVSSIPIFGSEHIESSADIYYFSVGNYSGKFMINFDGSISSVTTSGKGECKVDISEYNIVTSTDPYSSKIKITTDDGYTYIFGGVGYGALEYTALSWQKYFSFQGFFNKQQGHTISAYYLTKIIAPNKRELIIHYRDIDNKYHIDPYQLFYTTRPEGDKTHLQYSHSGKRSYIEGMAPIYDGLPFGTESGNLCYQLTKVALIDRIETDQGIIKFFYSDRNKRPNYSFHLTRKEFPDFCGAKLDSVSFWSVNNEHCYEKTILNYDYHSGDRLFLSSVANSKTGKYQLDYNRTLSSVGPMTTNYDHWGFWRGAGVSGGLFPTMRIPTDGTDEPENFLIESDDREPTGQDCDATLLREITFPTGGCCQFEYEPNTFSRRLEIHAPTFVPTFQYAAHSQTALAGGARIKCTRFVENGQIAKQLNYTYDYNLSAGYINYFPIYQMLIWCYNPSTTQTELQGLARNSDGINYRPINSEYISYQYVGEQCIDYTQPSESPIKSLKLTTFTSLCHNADIYETRWGMDPSAFGSFEPSRFQNPDSFFGPNRYLHQYSANMGMKPILNAAYERGKILSETYYGENWEPIRKIQYDYQRISRDTVYYIYSLPTYKHAFTGIYSHIGKECFNKYLPIKKQVTEYSHDNSSITTTEEYTYNTDGYLTSSKYIQQSLDPIITTYNYTDTYQIPPEKMVYTIKNKRPELIYFERYLPYLINSNWSKVKSVVIGHGTTENTLIEYKQYDSYGNPIHMVSESGCSTIYLWSYFGQYLVAKIDNATYEDVALALGVDPATYSRSSFPCNLNILRERLPNAHITTYTHAPNIGILSSIAPSGQEQQYEYDEAGRLITIREKMHDGTLRIRQVNEYNILNK